jgi:glucosyl-3-phosphoglycerate synthase
MSDYNIVLALTDNSLLEDWIGLATRLLPPDGEIHACGMVTIEAGKSLSEGVTPARLLRDSLYQAARYNPCVHDEVHVFVDYQPFMRVLDTVVDVKADLLLVQRGAPDQDIGGVRAEDIFRQSPCDVVIISGDGWQKDGDVLLSLRGGPNMTLGVRVAQALADMGAITLFHAADQRRGAPDLELVMRAVPQISRTVTAVTDITEGIIRESVGQKAIVMGASFRQPEKNQQSNHPIIEEVYRRTKLPVVLVRGKRQERLEFHQPSLNWQVNEPLSTRVDRWFAENTFHSTEFSNLRNLLELKEKRGLSISIALPALNEEETVGTVIETLKTALMDDVPLIDEMVLVDSNSSDNTIPIAQGFGIPTYVHQELLHDQVGTYHGKGEALWKSLYVTKGDIVVWVDTDITNIHPRFIYGLIGPLLKYPRIQYVKGFYARPILVDGKLQAVGGGRVTELVARPLLNLFYPELSGIIQPLSGEYAGRREALEQVPFFSGYGVETGLLIDMMERYGLEGIAQSDLEMRVHHNQPLVGLSKMSFAILQIFIARLESRFGVQMLDKANHSMKLIVQDPERFALDVAEIGDVERPPMITIPAYQERHGRTH